MSQKTEQRSPLEMGLLEAMQAIDKQVLREVSSRSPGAREEHGVQKWEPIEKRIELISGFLLNELGENNVGLDSLLVLAQSFTKVLQMVAEDLGDEGLGEVRSSYVKRAFEYIERSAIRGGQSLGNESLVS